MVNAARIAPDVTEVLWEVLARPSFFGALNNIFKQADWQFRMSFTVLMKEE